MWCGSRAVTQRCPSSVSVALVNVASVALVSYDNLCPMPRSLVVPTSPIVPPMDCVQGHGSSAMRDSRDAAWADLQRIKRHLEDSHVEMTSLQGGQGSGEEGEDALDQFVVSTRMLPADANAIPSRPVTPGDAAWGGAATARMCNSGYAHDDPLHPLYEQSMEGFGELLRSKQQAEYLQGLQTRTRAHGGGGARPWDAEDADEGLYEPVSQLAGPPTRIPQAPDRTRDSRAILHGGDGITHSKVLAAPRSAHGEAVKPAPGRKASGKPPTGTPAARGGSSALAKPSAAFAKPSGVRTAASVRSGANGTGRAAAHRTERQTSLQ